MSALEILFEGDPRLRHVAASWESPSGLDVWAHAQDLVDTFNVGPPAVGLASPQVGVERRTMLLAVPARTYGNKVDGLLQQDEAFFGILVNPVVTAVSQFDCAFNEGCLSLPDVHAVVRRPTSVEVSCTFIPFQGKELGVAEDKSFVLDGMVGRVFQHEFDHLDGKLFIDHLQGASAVNARIDWKNSLKRLKKKAQKGK